MKIQKPNETNSWFLEERNRTDTPLVRLTKKRREKLQISLIRNEAEDITAQKYIRSFETTMNTSMYTN